MSWLGYQTILLVSPVLWVLVSSDIYKSVMWTTNNPSFSQSGSLSRCFGEDLEMRVHLQSSLPIVCPFDFIIMKTLPSKPATGVLYENFWIVYDKPSFDNCDVNMAYNSDGDSNKKLLECNSPEALKSFTYSIDFKAKTHANSGIAFVGGRYYYFLATSDGTDGSLNNTRGGHCNDPQVRMKFKVYICRTDISDEKCQNVPIGELLCPSDIPGPTTSSPGGAKTGFFTDALWSTASTAPGNKSHFMTTPIIPVSKDALKELTTWRALAIIAKCLLVVLLVVILVACLKRESTPKSTITWSEMGTTNNEGAKKSLVSTARTRRRTPRLKQEQPEPFDGQKKQPNMVVIDINGQTSPVLVTPYNTPAAGHTVKKAARKK